jgi:hypothetical protein
MRLEGRARAALTEAHPLEWCLILLWAYSLFSYPFYLKYFAHGVYQAGYVALAGLCLGAALIDWRVRLPVQALWREPWLVAWLALYMLYVGLTATSSLLWAAEGYSAGGLARLAIKFGAALLMLLALPLRSYRGMMDRYTGLMAVCAALALLALGLVEAGLLTPLGHMPIPPVSSEDDGLRDFYGLALGWGRLWLPGGFCIMRLQSFSDEPGTFAFALLPALIWCWHRHWPWRAVVMTAALLATWSVGAVVAGLGLLMAWLWRRCRLALTLLVALGVALGLRYGPSDWVESLTVYDYVMTKLGGSGELTSLGARMEGASVLVKAVLRHPLGLGAGSRDTLGVTLGVGWLQPLIEAGPVGLYCSLLAWGCLLWLALRAALKAEGELAAWGTILLVLAFGALQRAGLDESLWHWWLVTGFVRLHLAFAPPASVPLWLGRPVMGRPCAS